MAFAGGVKQICQMIKVLCVFNYLSGMAVADTSQTKSEQATVKSKGGSHALLRATLSDGNSSEENKVSWPLYFPGPSQPGDVRRSPGGQMIRGRPAPANQPASPRAAETPRGFGGFGVGLSAAAAAAGERKAVGGSPRGPLPRPRPRPETVPPPRSRSAGRGPSATRLAPERWDFPHRK